MYDSTKFIMRQRSAKDFRYSSSLPAAGVADWGPEYADIFMKDILTFQECEKELPTSEAVYRGFIWISDPRFSGIQARKLSSDTVAVEAW